jgi:hypothetical protein
VDEDLLVLLVPGVDSVPVEGDVTIQRRQLAACSAKLQARLSATRPPVLERQCTVPEAIPATGSLRASRSIRTSAVGNQ